MQHQNSRQTNVSQRHSIWSGILLGKIASRRCRRWRDRILFSAKWCTGFCWPRYRVRKIWSEFCTTLTAFHIRRQKRVWNRTRHELLSASKWEISFRGWVPANCTWGNQEIFLSAVITFRLTLLSGQVMCCSLAKAGYWNNKSHKTFAPIPMTTKGNNKSCTHFFATHLMH